QDQTRLIDNVRRKLEESEQFGLLKAVVSEYWEEFDCLSRAACEDWVVGVYLTHQPERWAKFAVQSFGQVVERELKLKVFEPFRQEVAKTIAQMGNSESVDKPDWYKHFSEYFTRGRKMSLGDMFVTLGSAHQREF